MSLPRQISQRELRNTSGDVLRAVEAGSSFIVTRNGLPVAELTPLRRSQFAAAATIVRAFRKAPAIDRDRFFSELDAVVRDR